MFGWVKRKLNERRLASIQKDMLAKFDARLAELNAGEGRALNARYDAAQTTSDNAAWWAQSDNLSPTAANSRSVREVLRRRSRYEAANNSYLDGALQSKVNDVVGTGPMLQMATDSPEFNRTVEDLWNEWSEETGFAEKCRTMANAHYLDGEAFAEFTNNPRLAQLGLPVTLDITLSEADLWTDPDFEDSTDPNYVDGIQFRDNEPFRYKRLRQHPGDEVVLEVNEYDTLTADQVIHWYCARRPGQKRGIPYYTPGLAMFAEIRRYRLAVIASAEVAAEFAGVIQSEIPGFTDSFAEVDQLTKIPIARRMLMTLPYGYKLSQLQSAQPTQNHAEFVESMLKEVGRCTLTPLNIMSGSSQKHNFASARLDYLLYHLAGNVDRQCFANMVLRRVFRAWLDEALVSGALPNRGEEIGLPAHRWRFPVRPPIDEVAAAKAAKTRFDMGVESDEHYLLSNGIDPERHYEQMQRMIERRTELGMPLPNYAPVQTVDESEESEDEPTMQDRDQDQEEAVEEAANSG